MIRNQLKKNPYLIKRHIIFNQPKFDVIEKNVHGVKIIDKKHESKLKVEQDWQKQNRPNVHTYSPDDTKVKTKFPQFTFKRARKERTPSPDRRRALNVVLTQVKKRTKAPKILPKHTVPDTAIEKELEGIRLGPGAYKVRHRLTE